MNSGMAYYAVTGCAHDRLFKPTCRPTELVPVELESSHCTCDHDQPEMNNTIEIFNITFTTNAKHQAEISFGQNQRN